MSKLIKGMHHIALKTTPEQFEKTVEFYIKILGLQKVRSWGLGEERGIMISTGDNTVLEITANRKREVSMDAAICHFALATDDVDEIVKRVKAAGYPIIVEPKNASLPCEKPYHIRIAFCIGPVGEEIEFFKEK